MSEDVDAVKEILEKHKWVISNLLVKDLAEMRHEEYRRGIKIGMKLAMHELKLRMEKLEIAIEQEIVARF